MGVIVEKQQRGKRLRARRKAARLTQGALSKRAHISITYLSELENGKKEGKLGIWHALADALMEKIVADPVASKNLGVVLSVIEYLLSTDRNDRAAALLDPFLKHKRYEQLPMIWR